MVLRSPATRLLLKDNKIKTDNIFILQHVGHLVKWTQDSPTSPLRDPHLHTTLSTRRLSHFINPKGKNERVKLFDHCYPRHVVISIIVLASA